MDTPHRARGSHLRVSVTTPAASLFAAGRLQQVGDQNIIFRRLGTWEYRGLF